MSENDSQSKDTKASSNTNKSFTWVAIATVLFAILANRNDVSDETDSPSSAPNSHISTSSCISKVHSLTQYDRSRLKFAGQTVSSVNISYRNDLGRLHKFRCVGQSGTVQLYAEGAGMWMDM